MTATSKGSRTVRLTCTARLVAATALAALALALVGPPAQAGTDDRKRRVDASIDQLREDLEGTSTDLSAAYLRLRGIQAQLPAARADVAAATARVQAATDLDRELGARLVLARADQAKAADQLTATNDASASTADQVAGIARQAYQTGGLGELSVALSAQDAEQFARGVQLVDTAMKVQGRALAQLAVDRAEARARELHVTAVHQRVGLLKAQAAAAVQSAAVARSEAASAQARLDALAAGQHREVASVQARLGAERRRLAGLEAQSRVLQAQLAAIARAERAAAAAAAARRRAAAGGTSSGGGSSPGAGTSSGGVIASPLSSYVVTSEFGMRYHPIFGTGRMHWGLDMAAPCGQPVLAAADGRVVRSGYAGGAGNQVVVSHGDLRGVGFATAYDHLSRIARGSGAVSRGEIIGYVGSTGDSTGCHLHFETYENGTPVNPRRWL